MANFFARLATQFIEREEIEKAIINSGILTKEEIKEDILESLGEKVKKSITPKNDFDVRVRLLSILDMLWMNHLENLADLQESVRIRAYGQHDPLIEYRRESYNFFQNLFINLEDWIFNNFGKIISQENSVKPQLQIKQNSDKNGFKEVGRNDPCPCGSGKKYKKCHGK